jgi:predicted RNase H-like HicB family nuclease
MKQTAYIEKGSDGTYSVYSTTSTVIIGEGNSVAEAKADFENTLNELLTTCKEEGLPIPEDLHDVEFTFKYDIASVFNAFDFINVTKFAKYAGVNPSLLRQYKTQGTYISDAQANKIESALKRIGQELTTISL